MKKVETLKILEELQNHSRISNLWYNKDVLGNDKEDSIWYAGTLLKFEFDGRFTVYYRAEGDVSITHIATQDNAVSSGGDSSMVRQFLNHHDVYDDEDLSEHQEEFDLEDNNWFEVSIIDNKEKKWLVNFDNYIEDFVVPKNVEDEIEWLDETVKDYLENYLKEDE